MVTRARWPADHARSAFSLKLATTQTSSSGTRSSRERRPARRGADADLPVADDAVDGRPRTRCCRGRSGASSERRLGLRDGGHAASRSAGSTAMRCRCAFERRRRGGEARLGAWSAPRRSRRRPPDWTALVRTSSRRRSDDSVARWSSATVASRCASAWRIRARCSPGFGIGIGGLASAASTVATACTYFAR